MTNEEIQRVMEFIIKRQETFPEGMGQMRELHAQAEKRISLLETATVHLFNATTELNKAQKSLTDRMAELAEAQAHTGRRVNALIDTIADQRRSGGSQT
ncbi:MAG: hypothetical protein M3416_16520 [Acidobacteriota bacterium]|nr:hypothetical protein [Acidobacteriota bacterium]